MKRVFLVLMTALLALPFNTAAKSGKPADINVISYNIRVGKANDGTNSWQYRYPASAMMIMDQKPDIFGLQEALDFQFKYLEEYCPGYKGIGVGREDGRKEGEIMAIFYNKKTIKLIKWGTFWLSETPEKPSKGWDAACFRSATWALMKDKASGRKFYYVNTHLDHVGWEARKNGLKLIVDRIAEINPENYPMILTGDFNMRIERREFDDLKKVMRNAREVAFKTDHHGTFNDWGKAADDEIIDYIWFKGFSSCTEYETITKPYMNRAYVSDHYPIKATLIF
uniref:endonuclease/exonuclease/phosphatase family protein n=1 Tax=Candidatus Cryptobacteroides bacterium TaxID=3085639 RepID=UPI0040261FF1